jgi:hypothetical protein
VRRFRRTDDIRAGRVDTTHATLREGVSERTNAVSFGERSGERSARTTESLFLYEVGARRRTHQLGSSPGTPVLHLVGIERSRRRDAARPAGEHDDVVVCDHPIRRSTNEKLISVLVVDRAS